MSTTKVSKNALSFDIKSALLPLESVIIRSDDMGQVEADLDSRFSKHPDFFDNDPIMIDLTQIQEHAACGALDLQKLCQVLKKYKMNPVALRSNNPTHHAWAELSGLFLITQSQMPSEPKRSSANAAHENAASKNSDLEVAVSSPSSSAQPVGTPSKLDAPSGDLAKGSDSSGAPEVAPSSCALIIDKPLRSGQHVYAKGRDLVVMAMVNPGAEIMADGHIHVYAPLRGKAIAGARGNKDARIYTTCLEAELVSIAGVYRTSDTPIPKEVAGKSAQIRLIDDKLVMQPK
jgi:septum site-determining protein MinC